MLPTRQQVHLIQRQLRSTQAAQLPRRFQLLTALRLHFLQVTQQPRPLIRHARPLRPIPHITTHRTALRPRSTQATALRPLSQRAARLQRRIRLIIIRHTQLLRRSLHHDLRLLLIKQVAAQVILRLRLLPHLIAPQPRFQLAAVRPQHIRQVIRLRTQLPLRLIRPNQLRLLTIPLRARLRRLLPHRPRPLHIRPIIIQPDQPRPLLLQATRPLLHSTRRAARRRRSTLRIVQQRRSPRRSAHHRHLRQLLLLIEPRQRHSIR